MSLENSNSTITASDVAQAVGNIAAQTVGSFISTQATNKQVVAQEITKQHLITVGGITTCLNTLTSAYQDYLKIKQQEQTERSKIEAWEKATITKINAQRDFLMAYLQRSFDERAENFRALFRVVDQATTSGNSEQLALALDAINKIVQDSPLKELANLESVRANLNNPNHEWKF